MHSFQMKTLGVVLTALALSGLARTASATVIFEENFTTRPAHQQILEINGQFFAGPNITNTTGAQYTRGPRLAPVSVGKVGFYGDQSLNVKGLLFQPMDIENPPEQLAGSWGQSMHLPFQYTLGTDPIRLTLVARQAVAPPTGLPFWNNFAFGFSGTDGNLSNMLLLKRNPNSGNPNRAEIQLFHNSAEQGSKMYARTYGGDGEGIRSDFFRTLVLEYDPTKVNTVGVSPYSFSVDGVNIPLIHSSNANVGAHGTPENLAPMSTTGGAGPSSIQGISWGFWFADGAYDRSVLIESLKFEIIDAPQNDPGDFNGDGLVDGTDFLQWQRGETNPPLDGGALQEWKDQFGVGAAPAGSAVPEPASLAMLALGCVALLAARRRMK